MLLTGRSWEAGSGYRFGFQNQELDNELWEGAVNYKFRMEDPRLGRFFSIDPISSTYPFNSPYAFSENRLIDCRELEGLEIVFTTPWWMILAENNSTTIRPVTESLVKTGIERPVWDSKMTVPENIVNRTIRWGKLNEAQIKRGFSESTKFEQWYKTGKGGSRGDGLEYISQGNKRIAVLKEIKPNTTWGRSNGPQHLARQVKDFLENSKLMEGVDEIQPELHYYEPSFVGLFYQVKSGDNLSTIAKDFGVPLTGLRELNNLDEKSTIYPNQTLLLEVGMFINSSPPPYPVKLGSIDNTNVMKFTPDLEKLENTRKIISGSQE